ncbi:MAG: flagellar protein FlaG [Thiomicrorhabdus chilensis]|uniref:flagellar protein FlaG n=1 Tax=Thiomicrorhabdus chilensis TaxID=63656 RepID=UPI00299D4A01|nr:flagellar protein FlaG [Thiomicrorhabdus chilensis]MDX1346914.1 flagellar protein FlaG [Thiomicrorhabdus chilensis]
MADLNVIQPNNLETISVGRTPKSLTSSEGSQLDKSAMTQKNEAVAADIKALTSPEVNDLTNSGLKDVELNGLMDNINVQLKTLNSYLRFEKDEETDRMVILIKNGETDEVIRQIPSQEFLTISKNITNFLEMSRQLSEKMAPPLGLITHEKA